ncbi:MAG: hypothetical protein GQ564_12820 [Bacteroidales bacterium]|nr:hypothetical protein [Bacteroidales bacterium]
MSDKKKVRFYIFLLLIIIFASACKKENQTRIQTSWSAKYPTSIPFNIRNNEKNLGNIVINHSFEAGKVYYEEGSVKSYVINGWKKVGQNIKWVNSENGEFGSEDVYKGNHSIKIERNKANEIEITGEGIISDYLKVIPGNYSLKLFLKLEDIYPNQSRIGTKMYDAINIRLHFYDKNKIEISGTELDAFTDKKIDNTFKSLTLSNFWELDNFAWGEIHGITANFPYFDGDIPDNARYVKIFIGLKGTGKMWIDNVDFRYTNENFTMLERLEPYFDSSYLANDLVFPQPKQLIKNSQIEFFNQEVALYPIIVIPKNSSKNILESAVELKEILNSLINDSSDLRNDNIKIVKNINLNEISEKQFIISIGESEIYKTSNSSLPDSIIREHEGSYYIIQSKNKDNLVFINGINDQAIRNAITTFNQLFDSKNSLYLSADIIDYPDFQERALIIHNFEGALEEFNVKMKLLNQFKFNNAYFEWYGTKHEEHYPFDSFKDIINENSSIKYGLLLDLDKLKIDKVDLFDRFNSRGLTTKSLKSILLSSDSSIYSTNLHLAHIKKLNSFSNYINKKNISVNLELLPPWKSLDIIDKGHGKAEIYYYNINKNISKDISIYWTGGTYYSAQIDNAEYFRIKEITGTSPILYDNSLLIQHERFNSELIRNYYAGKIRTLSIFEPYNLLAFDNFYKQSPQKKILLNTSDLNELNMISLLTASNYYWNTNSYNADKSLWIVLNKLYGRDIAIKLIYFNDAYYGLKEVCQRIKTNGLQYKNLRIGKLFEEDLKKIYSEIETSINNEILLSEIESLKDEVLKIYDNLN